MIGFVRKTARLVAIVFVVSLASFLMLELVPGDPVFQALGAEATAAQYDAAREEMGLNEPLPTRYVDWLSGAVTGDFGQSIVPPIQDVGDAIRARLPVTIEIALLAMVFSLMLAVPLAMWTAHRAGGVADTVVGGVSFGIISVPPFLSALLIIFVVIFNPGLAKVGIGLVGGSVALGVGFQRARLQRRGEGAGAAWVVFPSIIIAVCSALLIRFLPDFPRQGFTRLTEGSLRENLRSAFLPAMTLALAEAAVFLRVLRGDLIGTLNEDFIRSAEAKGMPTGWILRRHALRPASLSVVTVAGVSFGRLLGGTVIIETIFGLPGMGTLVVRAIQTSDYPIVQGCIVVLAVLYVLINAAVDFSYGFIDPRIRSRHG